MTLQRMINKEHHKTHNIQFCFGNNANRIPKITISPYYCIDKIYKSKVDFFKFV